MASLLGNPLWESVVDLAETQWGVVSLSHLAELGCSRSWVKQRLRRGHLRRLHREVYAVGHAAIPREGRWLAAALTAGPGAAISHRSAAVIHQLPIEEGPQTEVSSTRRASSRPGVRVHRTRTLFLDDVVRWSVVHVTRLERTLIDLADVAIPAEVERAADSLKRIDHAAFAAALDRAGPAHRARTVLVPFLEPDGERTRSRLERAFRRMAREHGFPRPQTNVWVCDELADAYWPEYRVVVECDSHRWHNDWAARRKDHARDHKWRLAGLISIRVTWAEVVIHPHLGADRIRPFLRAVPT